MQKKVFLCLAGVFFISVFMLVFCGSGFAQGPAWMSATDDMPAAFIKAEDGNGDGKVSKDEFGGPDTMFDGWDKNQDGFIELSEAPTPDMVQGMGAPGGGAPGGAAPGGAPGAAPGAAPPEGGGPPEGGMPGGTPPEGGMPAGGFVANSPHVGDGPTGQDFIDVMDTDKDGKVTHEEWEMNKGKTVYKNKRWPNYNQNMDEYITLDEAPQKGVNWEEAPAE